MAIDTEQLQKSLKRFSLIGLEYAGLNYQTWDKTKRFFRTFGFNQKRQIEFIQDFATWLNDDCSPAQACRSIIDSGKDDPRLKLEVKAAESIYKALKQGLSISEGLADWFEPEVVTLFDAGQSAGSKALTKVVNEYLKQEAEEKRAKSEFWKPVKQPFLYQFIVLGFMMVMGMFVLPQFSGLMPADKMSSSVKIVTSFSSWMKSNYVYLSVFFFFSYIVFNHFVKNNTSHFRLSADSHFPLNIYRNFAAMKMMKTLGILVETRYNLHRAAVELKKHSNAYMTHHINHIIRETQFGESDLGDALNSGLLSKRLMFRLRNAANSPDQDRKKSAISIAADRSGDEAVRSLMNTRQWVATVLWVTMSLNLLLVVSSFMGLVSSLFNMSYR